MAEEVWFVVGLSIGTLIATIIFLILRSKVKESELRLKHEIVQLKKDFDLQKPEIRKDAVRRSRSALKGKIVEQFVAVLGEEFEYLPSDARFIGDPIDYIIFSNYTNVKEDINDDPIDIIFAEVKTDKSDLKKHQRRIRDAVLQKRVSWDLIRIEVPTHPSGGNDERHRDKSTSHL